MTNNINWASHSVKAGFTGKQVQTTTFAHDIDLTADEKKYMLSQIVEKDSIDDLLFADDKPYTYEMPEEEIASEIPDFDKDFEIVSLKEDNNKNVVTLTEPPQRDDTKELIINGALVFFGIVVLVKILS